MESNKKIIKIFAKHWIAVWLAIVSALFIAVLTAFGSYGDETKKMKRVVAPAAKTESLFTSNYLALGTTNIKSAYFENTPYTYEVVIRNYNPADIGTVFDGDITYTFTAALAHKDGTTYDTSKAADATALAAMIDSEDHSKDKSITISCGTDSITLNGTTISGSNSQTHTLTELSREDTWTITYTNIGIDSDYCVKLTATPAPATNLNPISATILVSSYPTVHQEGWECVLVESGTIGNYDAFNYTISGTGTKTLKFSYDSSKLIVNPAFYTLDTPYKDKNSVSINTVENPTTYSGSNTHGSDWKTIVIHADPDDSNVNRYDLQVYKVNPYQPASFNEITPNAANGFVEFKFE